VSGSGGRRPAATAPGGSTFVWLGACTRPLEEAVCEVCACDVACVHTPMHWCDTRVAIGRVMLPPLLLALLMGVGLICPAFSLWLRFCLGIGTLLELGLACVALAALVAWLFRHPPLEAGESEADPQQPASAQPTLIALRRRPSDLAMSFRPGLQRRPLHPPHNRDPD